MQVWYQEIANILEANHIKSLYMICEKLKALLCSQGEEGGETKLSLCVSQKYRTNGFRHFS